MSLKHRVRQRTYATCECNLGAGIQRTNRDRNIITGRRQPTNGMKSEGLRHLSAKMRTPPPRVRAKNAGLALVEISVRAKDWEHPALEPHLPHSQLMQKLFRTRAKIGHRQLHATLFARLVRDEARYEVARRLPNIRRRMFARHTSAHEIISEKLVRAPVVVGQLGKFTRETFDRLRECRAAVRFRTQLKKIIDAPRVPKGVANDDSAGHGVFQ